MTKKRFELILVKTILIVFMLIFSLFAVNPIFSAEENLGHEQVEHADDHDDHHLHYSVWLRPIWFGILGDRVSASEGKWFMPIGWSQPDLILNTVFVIVFVTILFAFVTRKLKKIPETKGQTLIEMFVGGIMDFFGDLLGEHGKKYVPLIGSIFIFILFLNYLGLIPGFQSPTADLNTTLALGVTTMICIHAIAIKENGLKGYLMHFIGDPWWLGPLMFPLHVVGELARAGSLAIRLFGNIYGEESVIIQLTALGLLMPLIAGQIPWLPVQVPMLFFGLFGGFLQAFVFSLLASIYLAGFLEHHDHGHETDH